MSQCGTSFEETRNLILEKFELVLSLVTQRREDLLRQLQTVYSNFRSRIDSKLKTKQELEQMREQMRNFYTQQNRASQVQQAALLPIIKEIESIETSLHKYKINFKFDSNLVETFVATLGEIVEPIYNTVATPPALPPRPLTSSKSASYSEPNGLRLPSIRKQTSLSRTASPIDEVEFTTVIPRAISNPQISKALLGGLSSYSNKRKPIFASCERGYEQQELISPVGMVYHFRDNCIYIVDQLLYKVLVLSSNGEYVVEFGSNVLIKPNSIAVFNHHCCVSDESLNGIVRFDLSNNFMVGKVASFPKGSSTAELSQPKGIDFDAGCSLYIADSGNDRITILDEKLAIRMVFNCAFQSPQDVKVMKEIIYVLDCNPLSSIHVFTLSGTSIRSIISSGRDITSPNFFCLDISGYLLISDRAINGVSVFSLDGKPVCRVGEETVAWEDGVTGPTGVCVTKDNKVVCAFSRGESVICFY